MKIDEMNTAEEIKGGVAEATATPGKILNAQKAMNILGPVISGKDTHIELFSSEGQLTSSGELYAKLGEAITSWQNDLPANTNPEIHANKNPEYQAKTDSQHKEIINARITAIANKICGVDDSTKKGNDNLAVTQQAVTEVAQQEDNAKALSAELIKKFHDAKGDPKSALFKSTMNQTKVQVEYREKIKGSTIKPSKSFGTYLMGEKSDINPNVLKYENGVVTLKARTKDDGRLMARTLAEKNGFDPTKNYTLTLKPFTSTTRPNFFALEAAVGFMSEHREYGAGASVSLDGGDKLTFADFATSEHNPIVKYNNGAGWLDKANPALSDKRPAAQKTGMDLSVELIISDARKAVLKQAVKNNIRLDPSNLAMMNIAIRSETDNVINEAKKSALISEGGVDGQKSMFYSGSSSEMYINNDIEKQLKESVDKVLSIGMSPAQTAQLKEIDSVITKNGDHTVKCNIGTSVNDSTTDQSTGVLQFNSDQKFSEKGITDEQQQKIQDNTWETIAKNTPGTAYSAGADIVGSVLNKATTVAAAVTTGSLAAVVGVVADAYNTIRNRFKGDESKVKEWITPGLVKGAASNTIKAVDAVGEGATSVRKGLEDKTVKIGWAALTSILSSAASWAYHIRGTDQSHIKYAAKDLAQQAPEEQAENFAKNLAGRGLNLRTSDPTKGMIRVQTDKIAKQTGEEPKDVFDKVMKSARGHDLNHETVGKIEKSLLDSKRPEAITPDPSEIAVNASPGPGTQTPQPNKPGTT
ncbi:MAG: hypothetical protein HON78_00140 [Legionellales bacterium]|nr:hypothetical protein [Legionellales bacterium]